MSCGCVIMASGDAKRFGGKKLVSLFRDKPLVSYIMENSLHVPFSDTVVVTRWKEVADIAYKKNMSVLFHSEPFVNDTIRLGTSYIVDNGNPDGIMYCVGDQPLLAQNTIERMLASFDDDRNFIVRLAWKDSLTKEIHSANPVIFPRVLYGELLSLPQGETGRLVIAHHLDIVQPVFVQDKEELLDIDTPQDMASFIYTMPCRTSS